jgi:hypothetical protein
MTVPPNSISIIFSTFKASSGHSFTHFMHSRQKDAADTVVLTGSGLSSALVVTAANLWFIPYLSVYTLLKKQYNMSPKAYLIQLRIQHACDLLKYEDFSISSISEMVGYQNVYYFSQSFKKTMGISPSEYRKKYS